MRVSIERKTPPIQCKHHAEFALLVTPASAAARPKRGRIFASGYRFGRGNPFFLWCWFQLDGDVQVRERQPCPFDDRRCVETMVLAMRRDAHVARASHASRVRHFDFPEDLFSACSYRHAYAGARMVNAKRNIESVRCPTYSVFRCDRFERMRIVDSFSIRWRRQGVSGLHQPHCHAGDCQKRGKVAFVGNHISRFGLTSARFVRYRTDTPRANGHFARTPARMW